MISQSQLYQLQSSISALQASTAQLAATVGAAPPAAYQTPAAHQAPARSTYVSGAGTYAPQQQYARTPSATAGAQLVQGRPASVSHSVREAAGTASSRLRDVWTTHISQFRNKFNPNGPSMAPNCGPAAVTMALRLVGLDIPGFQGQRDQRVLDHARVIATGKNDTRVGTTDTELERVIGAAGGRYSESQDFNTLTSWVKQGIPVIMAGNPAGAWNRRISGDQVYPYNGGHWVTVSGFDASRNQYIVNDPLSAIGPIYVPEAELASYFAPGKLGIGVYR